MVRKIRCVDTEDWFSDLTINKIYKDYDDDKNYNYFLIFDDKNYIKWYPKRLFKFLDEYRNDQIDKLLGE